MIEVAMLVVAGMFVYLGHQTRKQRAQQQRRRPLPRARLRSRVDRNEP